MAHQTLWSALALGWIAVGKLFTIGMFEAWSKRTAPHTIVAGVVTREQRQRELRSLWLIPADAVLLFVANSTGLLHLGPESVGRALGTFVLVFVWVEIWFYWSHLALHRSHVLWRFHRHHHLSQTLNPLTAASFSTVEKLFFYSLPWVGFVTLLSAIWPVSFSGVTLYYVVYYFSSPLAHSNREARPEVMHRVFGVRWFATPSGHALHHAYADANFGFFTNVLDHWLGTARSDTESVYQRARAGNARISVTELAP
jgi:Delta7-sterol 5-desaturase